jgi:hypothetical protein
MTWLLALDCFAPVHLLDLKSPSLFHYMFAYAVDAHALLVKTLV